MKPIILEAAATVLKTRMYKHAGEWARHNRILPPDSAEPGPYCPEKTPYLLPIFEAVESTKYHQIVVMMGAQQAKTDGLCLNVMGYWLDCKPAPMMYVVPTQAMAEAMSKDRFDKMLKSTPSLWGKLAKGRKNQVTEKYIAGTRLAFAWASSASNLCSMPACLVILDERDRMPDNVDNEGDPVILADARTATYPNSKVIIISTPLILNLSPIYKLYEAGTQNKWCLPCPQCKEYFFPMSTHCQWEEKDGNVKSAWLVCPNCKAKIDDEQRKQLLPQGKYIAENPEAGIASFWVDGLCSPWRTIFSSVVKLVDAQKTMQSGVVQGIINTEFGEPYEDRGESFAPKLVEDLRRPYKRGTMPADVQVLTMGVDVQSNCLYYAIRGWGQNDQSWLIQHGYILEATDTESSWNRLEALIRTPIQKKVISFVCIDAGYRSEFVYAFCIKMGQSVMPCRGKQNQPTPIRASRIGLGWNARNQLVDGGKKVYFIDDGYFKSFLFSKLKKKCWFLPEDVEDDFIKQLTAEELVVDKRGRQIWKERNKQNHYLDAEKLNMVAAMTKGVFDPTNTKTIAERVVQKGINIWQ